MNKTRRRITDIPLKELEKSMAEYGRKKSSTVASSRRYLRSIGMDIKHNGLVIN